MVCCSAWGCSNHSEKGMRMHGFPADAERRKKMAHFEASQFVKTKYSKSRLRPDAIPTIFVHRPVVEKRAPAPRYTPRPVKLLITAIVLQFQRLRKKGMRTLSEGKVTVKKERTWLVRRDRDRSGVLTEVFDFLKLKEDRLADLKKESVLSLDEMAITPSVELHMLTGKLYGNVTLPGHTGVLKFLPSNKVSVVPIKDLLSFQEGTAVNIAPHLSAVAIEPSHFEKIKFGSALNVFISKATSAGLKYMVQQENRTLSYLTTAWFLEQVDRWFDLMSSRHSITALSRVKMEEYEKAIIFLQDIIHLFHGIKIGHQGGQFLTTIRSGSYQKDDSSFLADFLDTVEQNATPSVRVEQLMVEAYDLTQQIEKLFRTKTGSSLMELPNAVDVLEKEAQSLSSRLPSCSPAPSQHHCSSTYQRQASTQPTSILLHQLALSQHHCSSTYQHQHPANINTPPPTSTQPTSLLLLLPAPAPSQHQYSSTNQHQANITTPPPTSTQPTSLILHLPAPPPPPSQHH
ncbi:unnamed protein product [Leuciscus chuanchicus]